MSCGYATGLHRRWYTAVARPWIPHYYTFVGQDEPSSRLFPFLPTGHRDLCTIATPHALNAAASFLVVCVASLDAHSAPPRPDYCCALSFSFRLGLYCFSPLRDASSRLHVKYLVIQAALVIAFVPQCSQAEKGRM